MSVDAVEGSEEGSFSTSDVDESWDRWGERMHKLATYLVQPFWFFEKHLHSYVVLFLQSKEQEQNHIKVQRVVSNAIRGFFATASILAALPFAVCGMCLTYVGNTIQSHGCRYVTGKYRGRSSNRPKIFFLNACMLLGGLPYEYGVSPADDRFDLLCNTICTNNPDFVFLSEFNRTLDRPMMDKLKEQYSHFVVDIGLNPMGLEAGFFIAFRGDIKYPPHFIPFDKRQYGVYSGFITIETPDSYFICTHLDQQEDGEVQRAQLDQIFHFVKNQCNKGKRVFLMGSLNFERNTEQHNHLVNQGFVDKLTNEDKTYTNAAKIHLRNLNVKITSKSIDYMLLLDQNSKKLQIDLHLLLTLDQQKYALSDHNALIGITK